MSDISTPGTDADGIRSDVGEPNRDRADLIDMPPAQINDEAVDANTVDANADGGEDEDQPGDIADAARI